MTSITEIHDTRDVARTPIPHRAFSEPYWEGTRAKKLLLQFDPATGRHQFYPRPCGIASGRRGLEWREASGRGEIYSFTIARRARPPFAGHEPFFIVVVLLDEGVEIMANMVGCSAADMKVGLRVRPYWHPLDDGTHLLMFEPDAV